MSVKFKAVERVDPRDLTLPRKFYASLKSGDDVSFEDLAYLISKVSNLNYGQVLGALGSLIEIIELQLRHGRPVRLNTLGTFYLTLTSNRDGYGRGTKLGRYQESKNPVQTRETIAENDPESGVRQSKRWSKWKRTGCMSRLAIEADEASFR